MREYFQHDFYAMNDLRLRRLRRRKGLAGVGLWWCVVETLYQNDNVLHVADFDTIADENGIEVADVEDLASNYGLFAVGEDEEGPYIYSLSIARRLEERANVTAKSQRAAKGRWKSDDRDSSVIGVFQHNELEKSNTFQPETVKSVENSKIGGCDFVENSKMNPAMQDSETCNARVEDVQCRTPNPAMQDSEPCIAIKENKIKGKEKKRKEITDTTNAHTCAGEGGGGELVPTEAVPLDGMEEARRECEAELRQLLGNDAVRLLLSKRTRYDTARDASAMALVQAFIPEFTAQEALNGRIGGEHGTRLAEHYVNWLAKKEQIAAAAPRETKEQRDERYFRQTAGKLMDGLDLSQLVGGGD